MAVGIAFFVNSVWLIWFGGNTLEASNTPLTNTAKALNASLTNPAETPNASLTNTPEASNDSCMQEY